MLPNDQDSTKPNKKRSVTLRKIILIILAIVLFATASTMGYLYWIERENNNKLQAQIDQKTPAKPAGNAGSPLLAPAQAKYTATVGKFTLTLGQLYYIVVDLDGGFEGGPATRLTIGTRESAGEQTIISPHHANVAVAAYPASGSSYAERVESETSELPDKKKLANIKVDGVDAEVYQLDGLFTDKKIFFTKNNIVYIITAGSIDTTQGILDEVIKGFKFN